MLPFFLCAQCNKLRTEYWAITLLGGSLVGSVLTMLFLMAANKGLLDSFWGPVGLILMVVGFVAGGLLSSKGYKKFLAKKGQDWALISLRQKPVQENLKRKQDGFLVLDFRNDDYPLAFAKLNNGEVLPTD